MENDQENIVTDESVTTHLPVAPNLENEGQAIIINEKMRPVIPVEVQRTLATFFKSLSDLTCREYLAAIGEFFKFVGPSLGGIENLKRDDIIDYQSWLRGKGLASNTILKKVAAVSSLCKHLAYGGYVDRDLTYGVKRVEGTNKKPTADFTEEEVKKIFDSLNPKKKCFTSHRAIIAVGLYLGLRSANIRMIKIGDFSEYQGHRILHVILKGNKPHEIPIPPFCWFAIEEHIKTLKEMGFDTDSPDQWLFPSLSPPRNKPMSGSGLRQVLHTKLKWAGIPTSPNYRFSPHSMRATLTGHLLNEKDVPLEKVQELLGHANPSTTQKYDKRKKRHEKSPVYRVGY